MPSAPAGRVFASFFLIFVCGLIPVTRSTARTVAVPDQYPTIAQAVAAADSGDVVLVACGQYRESEIRLHRGVSLWSGTLQPDCAVIDAGGRGRVFIVEETDTTTSVFGFTITGGRATGTGSDGDGGAFYLRDASPRIANCVITNNSAVRGGGLYCEGQSAPPVRNCLFRANSADREGGAVYWAANRGGLIETCRFSDNSALHGGGLAITNGARVSIRDCQLTRNEAGSSGGGVVVVDAAPVLRRCVLALNWGGLDGGGIVCVDAAPTLYGCTLYGNEAEYRGGGILCMDSSPRLDHSIVAFHALAAIAIEGNSRPVLTTCILYGNRGGDWTEPIAAQAAARDNLSRDPRFCSPATGDFSVASDSWCLPENRPSGRGELIGAVNQGCTR
jgi:hypothetical protein